MMEGSPKTDLAWGWREKKGLKGQTRGRTVGIATNRSVLSSKGLHRNQQSFILRVTYR
jgi:hypothetical protein